MRPLSESFLTRSLGSCWEPMLSGAVSVLMRLAGGDWTVLLCSSGAGDMSIVEVLGLGKLVFELSSGFGGGLLRWCCCFWRGSCKGGDATRGGRRAWH